MTHDDQLLTMLKDLPLPDDPADRYASVVARRRKGDHNRLALLATALSVVTLAGAVAVLSHNGASTRRATDVLSSRAIRTAHLTSSNTAGNDHQAAGSATGVVDFEHDAFEISSTTFGEHAIIRKIGNDVWIGGDLTKSFGTSMNGRHWVHLPAGDFPTSTSAFDPTTLLSSLRSKGVQLERSGSATVDGVATTVYDVSGVDASQEGPFADDDGQVYVDADGDVRRTVSTAKNQATTTTDFSDFGAVVDIVPPRADDVVEQKDVGASTSGITTITGSTQSGHATALTPELKARLCAQLKEALAKQDVPVDQRARLEALVCT